MVVGAGQVGVAQAGTGAAMTGGAAKASFAPDILGAIANYTKNKEMNDYRIQMENDFNRAGPHLNAAAGAGNTESEPVDAAKRGLLKQLVDGLLGRGEAGVKNQTPDPRDEQCKHIETRANELAKDGHATFKTYPDPIEFPEWAAKESISYFLDSEMSELNKRYKDLGCSHVNGGKTLFDVVGK